jgi:Spy/CpxP family protein refolding chaperone
MITRSIYTATALLALTAAPALAQQHQHGQEQEGRPGMMACPMMQMHGSMMMDEGMMGMMQLMHAQPAMLLEASEALDLTSEQTQQLTALRDRARPEHEQHQEAAMAAHRSAAAALEGDAPDLDAYAAALGQASDHMVMAHVAMTRTAFEAREILTPEQREKLRETMTGMHNMGGGTMDHGIMQGSMRRPGGGR